MSKVEAKNDASNMVTVTLDGNNGNISAGGNQQAGVIHLKDKNGKARVDIQSLFPATSLYNSVGKLMFYLRCIDDAACLLAIGGNGATGRISLHPSASVYSGLILAPGGTKPTPSIELDGGDGSILLNKAGVPTIVLDPQSGNLRVGGMGVGGDIALYPAAGAQSDVSAFNRAFIQLDGNHGNIVLRKQKEGEGIFLYTPEDSIVLNGQQGDIYLSNADCAEEFDVSEGDEIEPGTVMVLDQEGKLRQSREAYDKKVAGVISGAGDYKPGIVLDKQHSQDKRLPVALMGKVYCKVDAESSPIAVGDLLTTSPTPGHAMKACDPLRAFGAVIGKALRPLTTGQGLIPILIALQ